MRTVNVCSDFWLNLEALVDLQGKTEEAGELHELGAEAVLELGDVTHTLHSWQSPFHLRGVWESWNANLCLTNSTWDC